MTTRARRLAFTVVRHAIPLSFAIQLGLLVYASHVDAHPERYGGLRYTDVDWSVVADGLGYMASTDLRDRAQGWLVSAFDLRVGSPYRRATFRYTPLLPLLVSPALIHPILGKLVLVLATLAVPYLILSPSGPDADRTSAAAARATSTSRASAATVVPSSATRPSLLTHLTWTLNPLVLQITTRGSPEAFVCLAVALIHLCLRRAGLAQVRTSSAPSASQRADTPAAPDGAARQRWADAAAASLALGTSYKLFPAVYAVPIYFALARRDGWVGPGVWRFAAVGLGTMALINGALWSIWGKEYLDHTFLYHLTRKDHRHNFSPYFLPIYLSFFPSSSMLAPASLAALLPPSLTALAPLVRPFDRVLATPAAAALLRLSRSQLASFLPQTSLVVLAGALEPALGTASAMFLQTAIFIVFNKVCTSQYFLWPLPLLSHLATALSARRLAVILGLWVGGQALWLATAYRLEFLGEAVYVPLWAAGIVLFGVSVWGLGEVMDGLRGQTAPGYSRRVKDKAE
ncbi:GPI mannosyltransferase 1 [Cryptotrichosporon argae]